MTATWAIVAGGGTAGHVLPGLAIARALVRRGHPPASIHYVGSARGIEASLVPEAGFGLTLLPGRGIERKLSLANVGAVFGLVRAFGRAFNLVRRERPAVVVALGGYASVPCALAAVVFRVPIVVAEQNAVPGAANRLVSRFAKVCAVSFPGTPLPRAVVTGNPVRPEILAVDRTTGAGAARRLLGIDEARRVVLVFGGSLGALRLNRAVLGAVPAWRDRSDLAVRHVVGARDWDVLSPDVDALLADPGAVQYQAIRYEERMPAAFAAADVAVTRAGSSTVFELAAAGLPAVLVPSPHVTADHQSANARVAAAAGAAVVVPDAELDPDRLRREVDELIADPARRARMAEAARSLARPDAADAVARLAETHARSDRPTVGP